MESGKVLFTLFLLILVAGAIVGVGHAIFRYLEDDDVEHCYTYIADTRGCIGDIKLERSIWTGHIVSYECGGHSFEFTKADHKEC